MFGITFNNRYSCDLGIEVMERKNNAPSKTKITETVPFMNGSYDFSNLYGSQCYEERELEYTFLIVDSERESLQLRKIDIENWLNNTNGKIELVDDNIKNFYYLAECIDIDWDEFLRHGEFTVKFKAYPFKISSKLEGSKIKWDDFCFYTDILQETAFNIEGNKIVNLINVSAISIEPTIVVNGKFNVIHNGKTFSFQTGSYKDWRFKLSNGENIINIHGNGYIEFQFRKEVL